jgi:hypothetical protein
MKNRSLRDLIRKGKKVRQEHRLRRCDDDDVKKSQVQKSTLTGSDVKKHHDVK